jgi:RNA polymerase sigma-70 factor (ECF subfamily)
MESLQAVMSQPPPVAWQPIDLEEVFRLHHAGVMRAAFRVTGNATDAEDVLQTVFMRLARRAPAIENIGAYLHRAAVNAALDLVGHRREGQDVPLEAYAEQLTAATPAADQQQQAREMQEFVRRAVAQLAPRTAEIFALHYFEGYSNQEIAGMLDLSASGVGVTLHRARTQLQEEIRKFLGETS